MEAMLAYLLKVSVSAILFYLFIRILMERETQHEYIRGLWVGAIVFSLVLPFIYVSILTWYLLSDCISGLNGLPGHMNTIAFSAAVLKKADAAGMYACV